MAQTKAYSRIRRNIRRKLPDNRNTKIGDSAGWVVHTGILADLLNDVKPRLFYTTHEKLWKDYEAIT